MENKMPVWGSGLNTTAQDVETLHSVARLLVMSGTVVG